MEFDDQAALKLYLELTAIRGGSGQEMDVAQAIIRALTAAGLDPAAARFDDANTRTRLRGNCGNLIVHLPGGGPGPTTMLSAHMDTVPICIGSDPVVDGDFVSSRADTGLGADDRAGCAAILFAALQRLTMDSDSLPPAVLLFTIQEEIGLQGARCLDVEALGAVDRAFNFDGGPVHRMVVGAIGGERMEIKITGIPAHAGVAPETGASAIVMAAKAINRLDGDGWLGKITKDEGVGTANVGVILGGEATNVVTPAVTLRAEARSHDPEFRKRIVGEIRDAFQQAARDVQNDQGEGGRCEFNSNVDYESFELPEDNLSIRDLEAVLRELGRDPERRVANGGLDANWLNAHGMPAVTIGCGQMNIHTADERLDIQEFLSACRVAAAMICRPGDDG